MDNALVIGKQIAIMFIILAVGFGCYKKGLITKEGNKQLSAVELMIVNPLLIFMTYQTEYNTELVHGLMWAFVLAGVSFTVTILLSTLMISKKREDFEIERFSSIYSNCGFIGIPLIHGIYGDEGVLYLTAYITVFNVLVWTHGYMLMKGERDFSALVKALRNPSVIAVFLGLTFYLTRVRLPEVPASSLKYITEMNTPLAMLIAGAAAAQTDLKKALRNSGLYLVAGMKLLIMPAAAFAACMLVGAPRMVLLTITVAGACPVATTGTMFAIQMDKKPERCSEFFAMTTLLSGLTLPLVTAVCTAISGW